MKFILSLFILFSTSFNFLFSQMAEMNPGPEMETSETRKALYDKYFNVEGMSGDKVYLSVDPYAGVKYLGEFNGLYFFKKRGMIKSGMVAYDKTQKCVYAEIIKAPETIKSAKLISAEGFGGTVHFFYSGYTSEVAKGNVGVFKVSFDLDAKKMKEPLLIAQLPTKKTSILNLETYLSPEKKYLGFVLLPLKPSCNEYKMSAAIFDESFNVHSKADAVSGDLEVCSDFNSCTLDDYGHLYLFYSNKEDEFESNTFKPASDFFEFVNFDGANAIVKKISLAERKIGSVERVTHADKSALFVSWVYEKDKTRIGYSIVDGETVKEIRNVEFNSNWVQSGVEQNINNSYEDAVDGKKADATPYFTKIGEYKSGVSKIEVIEKRTPIQLTSVSNSTGSSSTKKLFLNGDILFLKLDENEQVTDTAKIERLLIHSYYSSGIYMRQKESTLHLVYYSVLPGSDRDAVVQDGTRLRKSFGLYSTFVNLETFQVNTIMLAQHVDLNDTYAYALYLNSHIPIDNGFLVPGISSTDERLIHVYLK